eukprot:CAMPEP_0177580212 /NCGR_PEP_ID=MMETSP0419_2-20121207/1431_1 /TAXON_ID=582737 /ORGANISM="Tetraselmis sp., Strain GSL018" /LENGTH=524 /DNA_ID=CAMNT_0019069047 /DNA_START=463 /DNA_END=2037 /DNA_ORIENTATION=+
MAKKTPENSSQQLFSHFFRAAFFGLANVIRHVVEVLYEISWRVLRRQQLVSQTCIRTRQSSRKQISETEDWRFPSTNSTSISGWCSATAASSDLTKDIRDRVSELSNSFWTGDEICEGLRLTGWLGQGAFSNVYRAVWGTTEIALKVSRANKARLENMLAVETAVSFCSRHPNIVTTYTYSARRIQLDELREDRNRKNSGSGLSEWCPKIGRNPMKELGQKSVWEVQLLQECCDIGTLRSLLRKGLLRRRTAEPGCETPQGLLSSPQGISKVSSHPESPVSLQLERQFQKGSGSREQTELSTDWSISKNGELLHSTTNYESLQWQFCSMATLRDNNQDMGMVLGIAADIVEGMIYLHNRGIVHGDIKSSNILLKTVNVDGEQRACAKISDFGTSAMLRSREEVTGFFAGTPSYMAPEVIAKSTVSKASDVYSFGILLFEVASGQKPYPGRTVKEVMRDVVQHKLRPQIVVNLPRQLIELMTSCWGDDPKSRPTFHDIRVRIQSIVTELNLTTKVLFSVKGSVCP